jgi:hypothetical protein
MCGQIGGPTNIIDAINGYNDCNQNSEFKILASFTKYLIDNELKMTDYQRNNYIIQICKHGIKSENDIENCIHLINYDKTPINKLYEGIISGIIYNFNKIDINSIVILFDILNYNESNPKYVKNKIDRIYYNDNRWIGGPYIISDEFKDKKYLLEFGINNYRKYQKIKQDELVKKEEMRLKTEELRLKSEQELIEKIKDLFKKHNYHTVCTETSLLLDANIE